MPGGAKMVNDEGIIASLDTVVSGERVGNITSCWALITASTFPKLLPSLNISKVASR